jgi:hypothetical protein
LLVVLEVRLVGFRLLHALLASALAGRFYLGFIDTRSHHDNCSAKAVTSPSSLSINAVA